MRDFHMHTTHSHDGISGMEEYIIKAIGEGMRAICFTEHMDFKQVSSGYENYSPKKFFEEFKAFIAKGNVIDMAVAVVIGGAFGKIVTSLVNDIIMPLIGLISGGVNVAALKWVFKEAVLNEAGEIVTPEAAHTYGVFIQTVIDFLIIALAIFVFLKIILAAKDKFTKKEEVAEEPAEEEPKETTEQILAEIRDLLKNKEE